MYLADGPALACRCVVTTVDIIASCTPTYEQKQHTTTAIFWEPSTLFPGSSNTNPMVGGHTVVYLGRYTDGSNYWRHLAAWKPRNVRYVVFKSIARNKSESIVEEES